MNNVDVEVLSEEFGLKREEKAASKKHTKVQKTDRLVEMQMALELLESRSVIQPNEVFLSYNPVMAPFVKGVKKIISKLMRWYIKPLCDEQTKYNKSVCACISLMMDEIESLKE